MIGFKKNNEENVEETQERFEVNERQRVRRRVSTRAEVKSEDEGAPMGFSFGRAQTIDEQDDVAEATTISSVEKADDIVVEESVKEADDKKVAEESVKKADDKEDVEESVKQTVIETTSAEEPVFVETVEGPVPVEKSIEAKEETVEKRRSDAQKSLDRILAGGDKTRRDSLLRKVQNIIAVYNSRNSGVVSEDIQIRYYHDNMNEVQTTEDGRLVFPNQRVYYRGFTEEWDRVNEVRVPKGAEFEVDLGIGVFLPDGYELELAGVRELRTKYELELIDGVVHLSRQNAMFPIVVQLRAVGDMAYVQKHKSLIQARLVRV